MVYMNAATIVQFNDPSKALLYEELGFTNESALESFITSNIIPAIEGRIAEITGNTYTSANVPTIIKLVANQAGANVIGYIRTNRMGPVLANPQGFNLAAPIVNAFTPEILDIIKSHASGIVVATDYQTDKIADAWSE